MITAKIKQKLLVHQEFLSVVTVIRAKALLKTKK